LAHLVLDHGHITIERARAGEDPNAAPCYVSSDENGVAMYRFISACAGRREPIRLRLFEVMEKVDWERLQPLLASVSKPCLEEFLRATCLPVLRGKEVVCRANAHGRTSVALLTFSGDGINRLRERHTLPACCETGQLLLAQDQRPGALSP
jgi:hypothetical protein